MRHRDIIERVISTQISRSRGEHQGVSLGRHPENRNFGPIQDPGGRRIPPNSDRKPVPNPHQLGGVGQIFSRSQSHEGGHGQAVVN